VHDGVPFPLAFAVSKPKTRRKPGGVFQSKPQLAIALIQELYALGFRFSVVLADSRYGEHGEFTAARHRLGLQYVVTVRSNHPVWTGPGECKRYTRWHAFDPVFADGTSAPRCLRETVFGPRRSRQTQRFVHGTAGRWYAAVDTPLVRARPARSRLARLPPPPIDGALPHASGRLPDRCVCSIGTA
jgi:SRSO17 transposase